MHEFRTKCALLGQSNKRKNTIKIPCKNSVGGNAHIKGCQNESKQPKGDWKFDNIFQIHP